ncbi:hypothetical protein SAMN05421812_102454 [Asanoa hainanensis]|uniref:Uncharacterized protein n=1 Tax=Asanoa hainanensis TaxID=560556 RepID=A0A239ILB1_9ACTN|nr:hypothetical protein [Asanoa hainanensis]SNS94365.1 hypothetical protein SAMN05421812_102454 [Asanoa hainanensis]
MSETYDVSPQALRGLLETYWGPHGWRTPNKLPKTPTVERALAAGVMFAEPWTTGHDDLVERAVAAAAALSAGEVGQAFLASLTSRRLDLRSALGSYAVARLLPSHPFQEPSAGNPCRLCGLYPGKRTVDVNVLNFERFKWGGVRRDDLEYLAFDLEQFTRAPKLDPTGADIEVGKHLLEVLRTSSTKTTSTSVLSTLRMVPGNKDERSALVEILGVCGVLETRDHPGYAESYIPSDERELPARHHVDTAYPACWWTGADGVNDANLAKFLPQLAA